MLPRVEPGPYVPLPPVPRASGVVRPRLATITIIDYADRPAQLHDDADAITAYLGLAPRSGRCAALRHVLRLYAHAIGVPLRHQLPIPGTDAPPVPRAPPVPTETERFDAAVRRAGSERKAAVVIGCNPGEVNRMKKGHRLTDAARAWMLANEAAFAAAVAEHAAKLPAGSP